MISKDLHEEPEFMVLNSHTKYIFHMIMLYADDEGYLPHREALFRAETDNLDSLEKSGYISIKNGIVFIPRWDEFQSIRKDKMTASVYKRIYTGRLQYEPESKPLDGLEDGTQDGLQDSPQAGADKYSKDKIRIYRSNFEEFWNQYPRKVSKNNAEKAYIRILKANPEIHTEIMEGLNMYKNHWIVKKTEMIYIPHPATWLNGNRWEDKLEMTIPRKVTYS